MSTTTIKKKWYALEIVYNNREETRMLRLVNLSPHYVNHIRENMFTTGLFRTIDKDTAELIPPSQIKAATLYLQAYFFNNDEVVNMEKKGWQQVHDTDISNETNVEIKTDNNG